MSEWVILGTLFTLNGISNSQRFLLSYLIDATSFREDIAISDIEFSVFSAPAFCIPFGLSQLLIGRFIDKIERPSLVVVASGVLSNGFMIAQAFATDYTTLLWLRIAFSITSAWLNLVGYYIVGNYFSQEKRGTAMAIYNIGIFFGSALASISVLFVGVLSWQGIFVLYGGLGMTASVVSVLTFTQHEQKKPAITIPGEFWLDLRQLCKNRTLLIVMMFMFVRMAVGFAKGFFEPLAMRQLYPEDYETYGLLNSIFFIIGPVPVFLYLGSFVDRHAKRPFISPCLVASSAAISALIYPLTMWWGVFWLSMTWVLLWNIIAEIYIPISLLMILNVTTPRVRAIQTGLTLSICMLAGSIVSVLLGYVKFVYGGETFVNVLGVIVCAGCGICAVLSFLLIFIYPKDLLVDSDEKETLLPPDKSE